ncbi:MAG TPA: S46 family peptidase, partial [Chitinophagaceae bacterium]|nr:S46 family peptidase [Chitinophagaceae bacterium]
PDGVGKFGGDTDNWAWPRHTGDFGVFRIYASSENKPAPYSTSNVPYKPRRSVRINTGGVKENDFTFVYGFPGKTNEYLSSDGVAEVMNTIDPIRIRMRETRLDIMNSAMKSSEALFIKYAAKQAGIANYYKKWKGELQGLRVNNAIDKKRKEEEQFIRWVKQDPARMKKYGQLLNDLHQAYEEQYPFVKKNEYLQEAIGSSDLLKGYGAVKNYLRWMDTTAQPNDNSKQKKALMAFLNNSDAETDEMISTRLFELYGRDMNEERYTSKEEIHRWYQSSIIAHESKIDVLLSLGDPTSTRELIQADPAWKAYRYFDSIQLANSSQLKKYQQKLSHLYEQYLEAIIVMKQNKAFYPDANATLRVTYGKVEGVQPADGLSYRYYTTLDGAVAKHNEQVEEFRMPEELLELYRKKEYGKYAIQIGDKKTVPLAFLASNHTTGGNSGSPVFNAKGEMIGTNFDRIWEGTMSDILFDPQLCRNIVLDVRYTLFIIEKLGHARWIIDEMNLVQ